MDVHAAGAAQERLRPWLCLIVTEEASSRRAAGRCLEAAAGAEGRAALRGAARPRRGLGLGARGRLPATPTPAGLKRRSHAQAESVVARLLCPRRLEPESGVRRLARAAVRGRAGAGLGEPIATPTSCRRPGASRRGPDRRRAAGLPLVAVHDRRRRRLPLARAAAAGTQTAGRRRLAADGRDEARRRPAEPPGRRGDHHARTRRSADAAGLPSPSAGTGRSSADFADAHRQPDQPANTVAAALGPPLWGRWQAAQATVPEPRPAWLRELNLDPRHRAAAGLGARVVHEQREQLLAQAWSQVGEVERANQRLRQAQLARAQGSRIYRGRFRRCPTARFSSSPGRCTTASSWRSAGTAYAEIRASSFPGRLLDGAFRRLARPRGRLGRRLGRDRRPGGGGGGRGQARRSRRGSPRRRRGRDPPGGRARAPDCSQSRPGCSGFKHLTDYGTRRRARAGEPTTTPTRRSSGRRSSSTRRGGQRGGEAATGPALGPASLRQRMMAGATPR